MVPQKGMEDEPEQAALKKVFLFVQQEVEGILNNSCRSFYFCGILYGGCASEKKIDFLSFFLDRVKHIYVRSILQVRRK